MTPIQIGPHLYVDMLRCFERDTLLPPEPARDPIRSFMGVQIVSNPAFPMHLSCGVCGGSGEDADGTDCPKCRATGGTRVVGYMGAPPTIITDKLPRLFAPRFPRQLVALPPISRGLP